MKLTRVYCIKLNGEPQILFLTKYGKRTEELHAIYFLEENCSFLSERKRRRKFNLVKTIGEVMTVRTRKVVRG